MKKLLIILSLIGFLASCSTSPKKLDTVDNKVEELLKNLTLEEKIGQLALRNSYTWGFDLEANIRQGKVGAVLNETNPERIRQLQEIAMTESPNKIPLLFARDVIHGYKTIFPIPLAMACSFNPELVEASARISAQEASSVGLNWTFAPMVDVSRDPRWGRIAESFGEDTKLCSVLGASMVKGFQGVKLSDSTSIAACAKHFAAYGAAEGGRDYNTVSVPENVLRDVYLPPFKACVDAGVSTFMTAFNEINGIPASGNKFLVDNILLHEWNFPGFVVSDWASVEQLITHGYSENKKEAAFAAFDAGCHMEMATTCYDEYLKELLNENRIPIEKINDAVRRILKIKYRLGLFDDPYKKSNPENVLSNSNKDMAKQAAIQSAVLLKNENHTLPLKSDISSIAVIGPLADAPHEQLGTWIFDGNKQDSETPLQALKQWSQQKGIELFYEKTLKNSRDKSLDFAAALQAAQKADHILCFLGEESILSGESHCRADISLPGSQEQLVEALSKLKKPLTVIILAGRPLTIENTVKNCNALLYAWHGGTMAGPALLDLLRGEVVPSAKLSVSFPRHSGQIPMYYSHKNTGKPATPESFVQMDSIPEEAPQLSIGNTSHYIDYGFEPLFPFGYGLSYTQFKYSDLVLNDTLFAPNDTIEVSVKIKNTGNFDGEEIFQIYTRDHFASRTRPVKELKAFGRVKLKAGESKTVTEKIPVQELAFWDASMQFLVEPGTFSLFAGGSSSTTLSTDFQIMNQ